MASPDTSAKADVSLRVPADTAYVSVLRTMTAGLAARLDFTVDDIEDLRIAVGEACALVLPDAVAGGDLVADFRLSPGLLTISVRVPSTGTHHDHPDSFAWQVLSTLTSSATSTSDDSHVEVTFTTESSMSVVGPGPVG